MRPMRGVALVIVLLLLSMTVLIAAEIMERLEQDRTRTENALLMEQGYAYLLSAEALGMRALAADREDDRQRAEAIDACSESDWAVSIGPMLWDNGIFAVSIQDLQGRFNLNNLVATKDGERTLDRLQVERLKRLLRLVLPDANTADPLAEEAADWIDSNTLVDGLGGAEDTEYESYRTGNTPFGDVSELRALRSATAAMWRETDDKPLFSRYITALPEGTRLNVNTAPLEVLQAVVPGISTEMAATIDAARQQKPFTQVDEVLALPGLSALTDTAKQELKAALVVNSEYFQVSAQVTVDDRNMRLISTVYRPLQGGIPQVVRRDLGAMFSAPEGACNPGWVAAEQESKE